MKLTVYSLPTCGTCKKAVKWLEQRGYELDIIPIREEPPTKETLAEILKLSGQNVQKLFNTSGQVYRQMNLKDQLPKMSEEEKLDLLAANGMLIKRPLVVGEHKASVGFQESMFEEIWGGV